MSGRKRTRDGGERKHSKRRNTAAAADLEEYERRLDHEAHATQARLQETADERRIRLANAYLNALERKNEEGDSLEQAVARDEDGSDSSAEDSDMIARHLKRDAALRQGKMRRAFAQQWLDLDHTHLARRGHRLPVTCCAVSPDGVTAVTGAKDCCVGVWDVESCRRVMLLRGGRGQSATTGHRARVLAVAMTRSSGPLQATIGTVLKNGLKTSRAPPSHQQWLVASGGEDNTVRLWDLRAPERPVVLSDHRDHVTGLAFRRNHESQGTLGATPSGSMFVAGEQSQADGRSLSSTGDIGASMSTDLYSVSRDRTMTVWNVHVQKELRYTRVETLHGHTDDVMAVSVLDRERPITVGADRTARAWKIEAQSQLLFNGPVRCGSLECVAMLHNQSWLSGAQSGALHLWDLNKKKPVFTVPFAHGGNKLAPSLAPWVCSVGAPPLGDVCASGSSTGKVKVWKVENGASLSHVASVPAAGYVNGIAFDDSGRVMVCGTGTEHRLGRWSPIKHHGEEKVVNGLHCVRLHGSVKE